MLCYILCGENLYIPLERIRDFKQNKPVSQKSVPKMAHHVLHCVSTMKRFSMHRTYLELPFTLNKQNKGCDD